MVRDLLGRIMKIDPLTGKRFTKKEIKRDIINENRIKGKSAEDNVRLAAVVQGYELERTGRGHDFRARKKDILSGKVNRSELWEVKSGNAKVSKLQQKTKRNKSNYKVIRMENQY